MRSIEPILRLMAERKASDAYLCAFAPVAIKIRGKTVPLNSEILATDTAKLMLAEILSANKIAELEHTGELNVTHSVSGLGNFRISAFRQSASYAVVIRYIAQTVPLLSTLGLPADINDIIFEKRGLILIVGSAGAGKSTTMAAMLDHRNAKMSGHILMVEDPIEFTFEHKKSIVNQREVGSDTASIPVALRNALRQAPDVIAIGEIRDRETMSETLSCAQSGHLCIATLHAGNSQHALTRILNFYPPEARSSVCGELAAALRVIVSQRLLPTVQGMQVPAIEVLKNTRSVQGLLASGDVLGIREAIEKSVSPGLQSFERSIADLIKAGLVDREEGINQSDSPSNLIWMLANDFSALKQGSDDSEERSEGGGASFTELSLGVRSTRS